MTERVTYEVWAREAPGKSGRRKPLEIHDVFPTSRWQSAVKLAHRLSEQGYVDVRVRQVTITHEMAVGGRA